MRAVRTQASLHICADSLEPSLLADVSRMLVQNCIQFSHNIVEDDGHVYPRDIDFNQGDRCRKGEIYNYN